jgi:hypothetical protein
VRHRSDETLPKVAQELLVRLRASNWVDWYVQESFRARLRLMAKTIAKKWKHPPDGRHVAIEAVLEQANELSEATAVH